MDAARIYFRWRLAGGGLIAGVALRRGDRREQVADLVAEDGDTLLSMWVKIDEAGKITAIVPHSEMGQGAQTLTQMLADEMDANWADVSFVEAPAEDEYANGPLGKGYLLAGAEIPAALMAIRRSNASGSKSTGANQLA